VKRWRLPNVEPLDRCEERCAAAVVQAFAGAPVREREYEAANTDIGELAENGVGAGADLLGRLLSPEFLLERGDQFLEAQLVRGAVSADIVESRFDETLGRA